MTFDLLPNFRLQCHFISLYGRFNPSYTAFNLRVQTSLCNLKLDQNLYLLLYFYNFCPYFCGTCN